MNQWFPMLLAVSTLLLSGCNVDFSTRADGRNGQGTVIAEGTIFSVTYQQADGTPLTLTRAGHPPTGNGSWNIDAHGVLTADALVVTYPGDRTRGPHVIPFNRIIDIRFGDYGISNPGSQPTQHDHGEHAHAEHAAGGH